MKDSTEMKKQVLQMMKKELMGTAGSRFAPKTVTIDVVTAKPEEEKDEDLDEVLQRASEDAPDDMDVMEDCDGDTKRSLKNYFARK